MASATGQFFTGANATLDDRCCAPGETWLGKKKSHSLLVDPRKQSLVVGHGALTFSDGRGRGGPGGVPHASS